MARTIAKDHDQKRASILKSAAKVFAERGFDRASMSLLARECGISKANIYHYYDSKDAILYDILDSHLSALRDGVASLDLASSPPAERLHATVLAILLAYEGADHEHQVQINAMSALPEAQQAHLRGYQRELVTLVSDVLRAHAHDVFDGEAAKLRSAVMSVFGMLNWYYMWNSGAGRQAREDYARLVSDMVLGGVRAI